MSYAVWEDFEKRLNSKINQAQEESIKKHADPIEEKLPEKFFAGLGNQGATCYMNSLLQALYMNPEFRLMIYSWEYDEKKNPNKKDCIIYQL